MGSKRDVPIRVISAACGWLSPLKLVVLIQVSMVRRSSSGAVLGGVAGGEAVGGEVIDVGQQTGEKDVALLHVHIVDFEAGVARQVDAQGEVDELIVVAAGELGAVAGGVIACRLQIVAESETPVLVAALDALLSQESFAVGSVSGAGAAVDVEAVLRARVAGRIDVEEREAGAIANAERAFDDQHAIDVAGIQLADDGIEIDAGGKPESPVGLVTICPKCMPSMRRIGDECRSALHLDALSAIGEAVADAGGGIRPLANQRGRPLPFGRAGGPNFCGTVSVGVGVGAA